MLITNTSTGFARTLLFSPAASCSRRRAIMMAKTRSTPMLTPTHGTASGFLLPLNMPTRWS
jgi:hypothetical protein